MVFFSALLLLLPFCLHLFSLTIYGRNLKLQLIGGLEAECRYYKNVPVWDVVKQQGQVFRCLTSSIK